MKRVLSWLDRYWHLFLIGGCIGAQALVFLFFGEESYLTVQDNLDLFIAHFQVMNWQDGWFAQGATMPMLGGISRDCLSSEWNLYNILFAILPVFPAYMIGYFLKIFLGMGSFALLAKDIWPETFARYRQIAWTAGLCYGMLPLFPAYGLAFASIPLFVFLCRRIYFRKGRIWYAALFFYPLLSYFSYFGFFLLAYLACAAVFLSVRDKKPCGRLIAALFLLAAGYVCFEYRLFSQMLFSDVETIRVSMVDTDLDAGGILGQIWEAFVTPVFHASSDHAAFVLPVCLAFLLWRAAVLIRSGQARKFLSEGILWILLFILFNCVVNGLYYWGGFRRLFETLIPPLKGFQFNRTTFFNPFLWYAALFLVLKYLYDAKKTLWKRLANLAACIAAAVILLTPAVYNEFYWTCYHQAYRAVKHTEVNLLNFREYFSADLMEQIKDDIDYGGDYCAGYGLNPAVLEYSGIATLDGYLGFYPQSYKEEFTQLIRPAYDRVEEWRTYYGQWGARAYLYAGSGESIYNPYRNQPLSDDHLYIDGDQFRKMGGRYLFSRYELDADNMEDLGFLLRGVYSDESSPYTIYLYETAG
ncbi:MAG TPA: hypothetical protein H9763_10830 [Candidatus Eisenbergiella merdigallinarum]|uniref:YfhO family protein n=1 Tax=Candidatus Eisenbergiella merdigallinarum TaxID=2838552 RepID=A0A9D2SDE9_9FIRM|nr:hypothetical protein [Candidatus Eisenbergiella merdigallinarum]